MASRFWCCPSEAGFVPRRLLRHGKWTAVCGQPQENDHSFVCCSDMVFFWDILQRTIIKDLAISPYTIRFLCCTEKNRVWKACTEGHSPHRAPCGLLALIERFSLRKNRMIDQYPGPLRSSKSLLREYCVCVWRISFLCGCRFLKHVYISRNFDTCAECNIYEGMRICVGLAGLLMCKQPIWHLSLIDFYTTNKVPGLPRGRVCRSLPMGPKFDSRLFKTIILHRNSFILYSHEPKR